MKIIPPVTHPSKTPIQRAHNPKSADWKGGYAEYRSCLRWDFGFTCASCLLHESDLNEFGVADGWAVTTIEHRETQKDKPDKANEYTNCYYACRFCNAARSTKPLQNANGDRLLDPTADAWADHFLARDHCLIPTTPHGTYTAEQVYAINDDTRTKIRAQRAENLERWLDLIRDGPNQVRKLNEITTKLASSDSADADHVLFLLTQSRDRQRAIEQARQSIERYLAVPGDAPRPCRCKHANPTLPSEFERQLVDI
jgi:hypothetical protein